MKHIQNFETFVNEMFYWQAAEGIMDPVTPEDIISVLNTFDNYAEMSDDNSKNTRMRWLVSKLKDKFEKDKSLLKKVTPKLNQKGKLAIDRYFK